MKFHHICIQTNNYKESLDFYTDVLKFKLKNETKDFNNRDYNSWLSLDEFWIELQTAKKTECLELINTNSEGIAHFCLYSDNFDNDYKRILEQDIKLKSKNGNSIYEVENNRIFKLVAPEGTIIEIRDSETP